MKGDTILRQTQKRKMSKLAFSKSLAVFSLVFVTAFTMVLPASFVSAEKASNTINYLPPAGENWNKLRDIEIKDYGWGYGTTVTEEVYLEKDTRKFETHDWWGEHLVPAGWQSFDFSPYYENGTLEFDIVGKDGGESFNIGFRDVVHERSDGNGGFHKDDDANPEETNIDALVNVSDYISVTTEWQHASIPLKNIFNSNPLFDESKIQLFKMTGKDNTPITFWITNIKVTSPDVERSYAPVKVNQVGYLNYGEKYANISGYYNELSADVGTPFQVKRVADDSVAFSGILTLVAAYDELSGEKVFKADFSPLNEAGEYYVTVDGVAEPSVPFEIGPDVYDELFNDVQKFFYFQRANVDLLPEHAGIFSRTGLHKNDISLPLQSNPSVTKDVYGGWWDAGDMGKYVTAASTAVSDLLWAYESFSGQFTDNQLNIPESGNGIPDLIDEIKVETDFFLKMQEEQSGGFYAYVIREPAPGNFIIDGGGPESILPTSQTATTVGALAHAYIVFKDVPGLEVYANGLLASAVRGWEYLEAHPEFIAQPKDPKGDNGPYYDDNDLNDRFYAAAALYRATGENKYSDYVVANYEAFESKFETTDFSHGIGSMEQIGFYHYLSSPSPSEEVKAWFVPRYQEWRNTVIDTAVNGAVWRNSTDKAFYWGANSNVASVAVSLDIGSRIIGEYDERMIQVASGNLNYLLGINPLQLSFITGYGENRVHITHHEIYMRDFIKEMPNGYMPGGPNNQSGKLNFPAKAYNQATVDWESNEQALNYNSPLIYLTALLTDVENKSFAESIQLDSTGGKLSVGETVKVSASVTPNDASFKKLQVVSADENTAKVSSITYNEETGITSFQVTAINNGRTDITVRSFDGRIQATYQVEVVSNSGSLPGSGSGSSSGGSLTTPAPVTESGDKQGVTVSPTRESLEKAVSLADNGKITIPIQTANDVKRVTVELPGEWISALDSATIKSISVESLGTTIELDLAYLKGLLGKDLQKLAIGMAVVPNEKLPEDTRKFAGNNLVYDFSLSIGNSQIQWAGHPVTVKIPYKLQLGGNANQVVIYNVDNGPEVVKNSLFDQASGKVVFQPKHFSKYTAVHMKVSFKDIDGLSASTSDSIRAIAARGVINGKAPGQYDPQGKLTRAEFVQMLVNYFDISDPAAVSKFTDVKEGSWYYRTVASAEKLGIVQGKTDGTFGMHDVLSRQDMATLLYRTLQVTGHTLQSSEPPVSAYTDEAVISEYAKTAVESLKQAKVLVTDSGGSYRPASSVNRAEAAILVFNLLKIMNQGLS